MYIARSLNLSEIYSFFSITIFNEFKQNKINENEKKKKTLNSRFFSLFLSFFMSLEHFFFEITQQQQIYVYI